MWAIMKEDLSEKAYALYYTILYKHKFSFTAVVSVSLQQLSAVRFQKQATQDEGSNCCQCRFIMSLFVKKQCR